MERSFAVLGPLQVAVGDRWVTLTSRKQQLVLARLLVNDGVVAEDELVDVLWSEHPPPSALTSLRAHVSRLRAALAGRGDDEVIVHGSGGYRLAARGQIDSERFEERCTAGHRAARSGDLSQARDELAAGLSLWRGEALAGFRYEPFAQPSIARLEVLHLQAHEERIALDLQLGDAAAVLPELQELAQLHPLRERVTELLMQAQALTGRTTDALATYRDARERWRSELGLEPPPTLGRLHQRLLAGEVGPVVGSGGAPVTASAPTSASTAAWQRVVEGIDLHEVSDRLQLDLLLARADGLRRAGRVAEARSTYAAAARLASSTDREEQLASAVLGLVGPPEDSLSELPLDEVLVERAMLRLPPDHPVLARLRARLAVALIDRGTPSADTSSCGRPSTWPSAPATTAPPPTRCERDTAPGSRPTSSPPGSRRPSGSSTSVVGRETRTPSPGATGGAPSVCWSAARWTRRPHSSTSSTSSWTRTATRSTAGSWCRAVPGCGSCVTRHPRPMMRSRRRSHSPTASAPSTRRSSPASCCSPRTGCAGVGRRSDSSRTQW